MHGGHMGTPRRPRQLVSMVVAVLVACGGLLALPPAPATAGGHHPAKVRPTVASVKPASGGVTGGTRITIRGKNLTKVRSVTVGGLRADSVRTVSSHKIVAVTPAGLPGRSPVQVRTQGGTNKPSSHSRFTYVEPQPADSSSYEPAEDTVVGDGVQWVSGGSGVEDPQAGSTEPWLVGLAPGADVPDVGSDYFLPPGSAVFPSGLAGRVADVATQADGGTAITVQPVALSEVMDGVAIDYAGPVGEDVAERPGGRRSSGDSVTFSKLGASAFECTDRNHQTVDITGELSLSAENVRTSFYLQTPGIGVEPALDTWVLADLVLSGKVTASCTDR